MGNTVLHELLAVEQSLAATANLVTKSTIKNLGQKQSLYLGLSKAHEIFNEDDQHLVQTTEYKEVESTVDEQLDYLNHELANYWNVSLQKEEANQRASADIIIGTTTLATAVPAIVLLGMEKKLSSLLEVYNAIPTLDAATAWEEDPNYAKPGVFRTKYQIERMHTVTSKELREVSPATEFHKAQIAEVGETNTIGKYKQTNFSGQLTSVDKAGRIQRLTELIRAVKTARQRANNETVNTDLVLAQNLFDYIKG